MIPVFLSIIFLVSFVNGCELFTSLDEVVFITPSMHDPAIPYKPRWDATLSWAINGKEIKPSKRFTMKMPCVYKFCTDKSYIPLIANHVEYGQCYFKSGEIFDKYSKLECVISNNVIKTTNVKGQIRVPLVFNAGGSALCTDRECAKLFKGGSNVIEFSGGKKFRYTVNFTPGLPYNTDKGVFHIRGVPSKNKVQPYLVAGNCPQGYSAGYFGFEIRDSMTKIDCCSYHAKKSKYNEFNSWMFAKTEHSISKKASCGNNRLEVTYKDICKDYRPYLDALLVPTVGHPVKIYYYNRWMCKGDPTEHRNDGYYEWTPESCDPTNVVTTTLPTATVVPH
ncbi:uncharacterized protein SPAPADRAFT_50348 [Spathaspora passalidarum NRRL Y-27907]|uniref:Agglutinin-like protein N-terminal domain-containing protein n=2 Tax=Spathaspora passalidarum TaxID=340170 RepID=G3AMM8_SPAPN|nr:uncharacterized protein SPAPADRAFT_50348 [Spathaspora passalidarum NRRL Y-27907]EGW33472.1 hypothetical protein SPAPADRAFT_50348 [Spathaspora passalidarum NRRL Y-27907]QQV74271.1 agglutinin-like protein [Spathaspora passalidarum]